MLNNCYKYADAINAKGKPFPTEPLIMTLLLSQHKMIDWLTKQISKFSLHNNNKEVNEYKEQNLGRENTNDYIRKNERIIILMIISNGDYTMIYEFPYR
jgi:hypothetical protein